MIWNCDTSPFPVLSLGCENELQQLTGLSKLKDLCIKELQPSFIGSVNPYPGRDPEREREGGHSPNSRVELWVGYSLNSNQILLCLSTAGQNVMRGANFNCEEREHAERDSDQRTEPFVDHGSVIHAYL